MDKNSQFLKAYDDFSDAIFRHCYFRVLSREKAKDIMQDTFIRLWKYFLAGQEIQNIRALLYKMANNLIIDEARKNQPLSMEALSEKGFEPSVEPMPKLIGELDSRFVNDFIKRLDEKYRVVLTMRYIDDLSVKEIAVAVGDSENNISVKIHRGLKQLKEIIPNE